MSDKKVIDVHSITLFLISIYYFYNSFIKKQTYLIIYTEKQFFIVIPFICEYNSIGELKNID
jgi:hypothetical protein